jgi:hypothetical protein
MTSDYEQRQADKRERLAARAARARAESTALAQRAHEMASVIPFGQPMMPDHYSYKRDRNYRNKIHTTMGRAVEMDKVADTLEYRLEHPSTDISSDDPEAIAKIEAKVAELVADQETMKRRNALIRRWAKHGSAAQIAALVADGMTEARATPLVCPTQSWESVGYPAYRLSNNNANIARYRKRITELQAARDRHPSTGGANGDVRWYEDVEANRICISFPGKPDAEVIRQLRRSGFVWSPSRSRWQRQTSRTAEHYARTIVEALS